MRHTLPTRAIAIIAIGLAVASAVFCWRWASRYSARVEKHSNEILSIRLKQDQVEWVLRLMPEDGWTTLAKEVDHETDK